MVMGDRLDRPRRRLPSMNPANPRSNERKRQHSTPSTPAKPKRRKSKQTADRVAEDWYTVREILDERVQGDNGVHYLIDWDGTDQHGRPYPPSWEPARNVTEATIKSWEDRKNKVASAAGKLSAPGPGPSTQTSTQDSQPVRVPSRRRDLKRGTAQRYSEGDIAQAPGPREERMQKRRRTENYPAPSKSRVGSVDTRPRGSARNTGAGLSLENKTAGEVGGNQGGRIVIEIPQKADFNSSEFDVVSLSQNTSQQSSQSTVARRQEQIHNFGSRDQRVIPDSQEISATSASEAHNSLVDQDFAVSPIHSQATTNRASGDHNSRISAVAPSTAEIPSHQPDPLVANTSGIWGYSAILTDSRTTVATNRLHPSHLRQSTTARLPSQSAGGGSEPVFITQVPFDSDTEAGTSQDTRRSNNGSSARSTEQQLNLWSSQHTSSQDFLSANSVSSQGTSQAAQIVAPLSSQPHELSSQSQENFTVYDEVSNTPNTVPGRSQPAQDSQNSSQALSVLDGNTRTSSAPQDPEARLLAPSVLGEQGPTTPDRYPHSVESRNPSTEQSPAPPGHSDFSPRDSRVGRPATPTKMNITPTENAPLSARERLRLIRERNFGDPDPDESSLSFVVPPNQPDKQPVGVQEVDRSEPQVEPGLVSAAKPAAPLISPTFVVPSLEPEQGVQVQVTHEPSSVFDAEPAPIERAHPIELVLETGTSQLPYHGSHEEQPTTLNPSQLTLSIEGDMDVSPSIPTDDGIGGGYPAPEVLIHEEPDMPSDYPKNLLPYVPTGPNEYLVTLPFHTNIRPQYNDILRENEALIHKYNASFRVSPHQIPDVTTVLKLDEMFSRLFDICDFPPFLDMLSSLSPDKATKHVIGTNAKFSFIAEVLDILIDLGSDKKILILVRPGQLMDLLGNVIQSRGCRYIRSGRLVADSTSHHDLAVAVSSTTDNLSSIPKDIDAIIAFDHTFRQEILPSFDEARPPIILALANAASIQHLNMRIMDNLEPLERKNVLMLALVKAMRYVEDPDHAAKLSDIADLFAKYIHLLDEDDDFHWEAQELPEDIFEDLYAASSQTQMSQSSMPGYGVEQLPDSRKRSHMEDDDEVLRKRPKVSQMSQPQVVTDVSHISDSLKSLTRNDPSQYAGKATVTISAEKLEALANQIADLQAQLDESKLRENQFRELSDRSKTEVDGYVSSIRDIQAKFMDALKDRGTFEADCQSAREEANMLAKKLESSQTANAALKEKNTELQKRLSETTDALLNSSNPDLVKLAQVEKELDEAKTKAQQLEKRMTVVQNDMEYARNQYQHASQRAIELATENRGLEQQVDGLRQRADANIVEINRIQARREVKELSRMLQEQRAVVRDREAELNRARDELRSLRSGRRETRQSSVPRSPRLSALGVMSPRNGTRVPSAMGGGGSSRGTSPAPPPVGVFEGAGGGGGGAGGGAGSGAGSGGGVNMVANMPLFNQTAGNNRFSHLRDNRF